MSREKFYIFVGGFICGMVFITIFLACLNAWAAEPFDCTKYYRIETNGKVWVVTEKLEIVYPHSWERVTNPVSTFEAAQELYRGFCLRYLLWDLYEKLKLYPVDPKTGKAVK